VLIERDRMGTNEALLYRIAAEVASYLDEVAALGGASGSA
jgi:hypothetical protein